MAATGGSASFSRSTKIQVPTLPLGLTWHSSAGSLQPLTGRKVSNIIIYERESLIGQGEPKFEEGSAGSCLRLARHSKCLEAKRVGNRSLLHERGENPPSTRNGLEVSEVP